MPQVGPLKQRSCRLSLVTEENEIRINHDEEEKHELLIEFNVRMSVSRQVNRAQIQVLGLNQATRDKIAGVTNGVIDLSNSFLDFPNSNRPAVSGTELFPDGIARTQTIRNGHAYVDFDVGYAPDKVNRVFEGSSHWARHTKRGPVWSTAIDVGDGLSTRLGGIAVRRFDPGASTFEVIRYIVQTMGISNGNLTRDTYLAAIGRRHESELPTGFTVMGDSEVMLTSLLIESGAEWWVDRGAFWIVPKGQPLDGIPIRVAQGREGGLRYDPQPQEGGAVLLNSWYRGDARVGRAARVEARVLSGLYRIETVTHRGSNRRGDFQTLMQVRKIETIEGVF